MTPTETINLLARGYTRAQIAALDAARKSAAPEPETKATGGRRRNG
jgi:hypothetical protein